MTGDSTKGLTVSAVKEGTSGGAQGEGLVDSTSGLTSGSMARTSAVATDIGPGQ